MLMWPYHQIIQNLKGEIAISIQRGNAIAILAGYNRAIGNPAKLHIGGGSDLLDWATSCEYKQRN